MKSVKMKISLSFLVVTIIYSVILTGTILGNGSIVKSYEALIQKQAAAQNNLQQIIQYSQEQALAIRSQLISDNTENNEQFQQATTQIYTLIDETIPLLNNSAQENRLNELHIQNETLEEKFNEFTQLISNGQSNEQLITFWQSELLPTGVTMRTTATDITTEVQEEMNNQINENLATADRITSIIMITSVIVLIVVLLFSYVIAKIIAGPITRITAATKKLAQGDLTGDPIEVNTRDELNVLATAFNDMQNNWRNVVQNITNSSNEVTAAADELIASADETARSSNHITEAIQNVAVGARSTEDQIEENKRALEEVTIGVTRVATSTSAVSEISEQTRSISNKGRQSIEQVMAQMDQISSSTNDTAEIISTLNERSNEIVSIVKAITDISEQTNLLALNAAIEAARAGEHGKGFAVVADEVRKLAEQSHTSAELITELIHSIQADTQKAVTSMQKGAEDVAEGIQVVKVADEGFEAINDSVQTLAVEIEDITAVSEQMSASAQQLLASMEEISSISQTSASNSESVAAASEQQLAVIQEVNSSIENLGTLAESLRNEVKQFKI